MIRSNKFSIEIVSSPFLLGLPATANYYCDNTILKILNLIITKFDYHTALVIGGRI